MEALGIQPMYLLAQLINFAILFFVLKKFLYKPILDMLDKRRKMVDEGLKNAKDAEEAEEKTKEKQERLLTDAKKEVRALLDDAKKQAEEIKKDLTEKAHKEATDILTKAKSQADQQLKSSEASIKKQAVELASLMIVKLVPEVLSQDDHHKVIDAHLKELEKSVHIA